jgi:hypothetical protein
MFVGMAQAVADRRSGRPDLTRWRIRRISDYLWMRDVEELWAWAQEPAERRKRDG